MSDKLPIINKISYSALSDWQYCPYYYKLCNIDKLKVFKETVWTYWGTLIHRHVQMVLEGKMEAEAASKRFAKIWKSFCSIYKDDEYEPGKKVSSLESMKDIGALSVLTIKDSFAEKFGNYKVLEIERYIKAPSGYKWPQEFRGYVDIIIQLESGAVVIIDFKTCRSSYFFNKYKDKYKEYQLTLYKHFLCKEEPTWDTKTTETYFVTLERNPFSKKPIGFTKVTSGQKKIDNALTWLNTALYAINNEKWIKNRSSCLKYGEKYPCEFYKSENCK